MKLKKYLENRIASQNVILIYYKAKFDKRYYN